MTTLKSLSSTLESVFRAIDHRVEERWDAGDLSQGFWRSGAIPKLTPVDTLREYGFWQARGMLEKEMIGQVSVALFGGHTRMGLFLPNRLLEGFSLSGELLTDAVSKAHDGQPANIIRRVGGDTMFDRFFTEAPFSAEWLLRCTRDELAKEILVQHLSWRVINLWESALRTLISRQAYEMGVIVHSAIPLPPIVTESMPITFQEVYEIQPGHWVTVVSCNAAGLDIPELEKQLKMLLPNHGITVQKDGAP